MGMGQLRATMHVGAGLRRVTMHPGVGQRSVTMHRGIRGMSGSGARIGVSRFRSRHRQKHVQQHQQQQNQQQPVPGEWCDLSRSPNVMQICLEGGGMQRLYRYLFSST